MQAMFADLGRRTLLLNNKRRFHIDYEINKFTKKNKDLSFMKIFVANLSHKLEETELKTMLTQFGQVASVKLIRDKETGKKKANGFLEMPVREQAQSAIVALHDKELYGRKIALSEAVEKEQEKRKDFERPKREFREFRVDEEIDGNRW